MPKYKGNDYFTNQKRLSDQQDAAMKSILKISESESKHPQSYGREGEGGTKVAPMPGTYYDEGNFVDKVLDFLKIKPRKGRFKKPKPAGRAGYI